MTQKNSPTLNLTIDRLSFNGGRGVARYEGVVVFVPDTVPGDLIEARITSKKKNFWEAEIVKLVRPSPSRQAPPCPVAERCGGCSWQQVSYSEQLRQKQNIVEFALRMSKPRELRQIIPSPKEFRYRNRIQVHVKHGEVGFLGKRSHNLVPAQDCLIADQRLTAKFSDLSTRNLPPMSRVEIALTQRGEVVIDDERRGSNNALFSQVNTAQNENLIEQVLQMVSGEPHTIFDLYAGAGNITVPLAKMFSSSQVKAVELSSSSVAIGKQNSLPNIEWHCSDVAKFIKQTEAEPDLIVLDPPRAGLEGACFENLGASQIIYVSCDPITFARDAGKLVNHGYQLDVVQPLDMFPQTEHVELVAKFTRQHE